MKEVEKRSEVRDPFSYARRGCGNSVLGLRFYEIKSNITLRKKCPYSELFWSAFSRIWTEYGEILPR